MEVIPIQKCEIYQTIHLFFVYLIYLFILVGWTFEITSCLQVEFRADEIKS